MAGIAATYVSATSFTISGDHTDIFTVGRRVKCDCGASGFKNVVVASASCAIDTTVVVSGDALDANLVSVKYGVVGREALPEHMHTEYASISHSHVQGDLTGVPRILYGSSSTPPDAAGLPNGTIYIQIKE